MLVSSAAGPALREEVAQGSRPAPEYLRIESRHGVDLLDWTSLGLQGGRRTVHRSLYHCLRALGRTRRYDAVLSDGEHVGIPLGLAMHGLGMRAPHVMIGHNLLSSSKLPVLRRVPPLGVDRILVHSGAQVVRISGETAIPRSRLHVVHYGTDCDFWSGGEGPSEPNLVVSAGREHRDYRTLVDAIPPGARLAIADHSLYTPDAERDEPDAWPETVERVALDPIGLRRLYARAGVVVVPVLETPIPFGVTTVLEAMSMGKALVATDTPGLREILEHGKTAMLVPPGDRWALRAAISRLLGSPRLRDELGSRARATARRSYDVDSYADELIGHCRDAVDDRRRAIPLAARGGPPLR